MFGVTLALPELNQVKLSVELPLVVVNFTNVALATVVLLLPNHEK
jgi:hypothetical protein